MKLISKFGLLRFFNTGAVHATNTIESNSIFILNVISFIVFVLNTCSLFFYYFNGFVYHAFLDLISCILHYPYYLLVKKGHFLASKIYGVECYIIFVFFFGEICGNLFPVIHFYFLIIILASFIFKLKDFFYLLIIIVETLLLYMFQAIHPGGVLHINTLPHQRAELFNTQVSIAYIIYMAAIVFCLVFIVHYQEAKLRNLKKKLEQRKKKLLVQNEELYTFGLAATHSLKTPLFIINSFLNKIKRNLDEKKYADLNKNYIEIIKSSNKLIEKYSEGLILYNYLLSIDNKMEYINIQIKIDEVISFYKITNEKAVLINNSKPVVLFVNPALIEIILQNVVENALKYNNSLMPRVELYTYEDNDKISLFIADNGIGIRQEFMEKIFLPFNRLNDKSDVMGSGLGLTAARIASRKINGRLYLKKSNNEGSVFLMEITKR